MSLIEKIEQEPGSLKNFDLQDLATLSNEIREVIIQAVAKNGGHLSSNLGIVELTLALHKIFSIPPDKIIWDVGHQCYAHKILTGRRSDFTNLRKYCGLSGFPAPEESITDIFRTGHAGTAISSAAGLKTGQNFKGDKGKVVAVIGDGSLTNGLTFEGLNFIGSQKKNLLLILNDNKMSISSTKGALSYYLTKLISSPFLHKPKEEFVEILKKIPSVGDDILRFAQDFEQKAKYLIVPGVFFEKLGLRYFGPIDGHDMNQLLEILVNIKDIKEPVLLHVVTKKGKGYAFAEKNPEDFHGAGPFDINTGTFIKREGSRVSPGIFAGVLLEKIAEKEKELVVLTAAMEKGLGLENFAKKFPDRFFDVGIAEGHCITFASGLAKAGMKVVVAIYSTFLQRGYDQIFHDICLQGLPVVFLVDRAGLVEDGPTHHGVFDISFLRVMPMLKIFTPYSIKNLEEVLLRALGEKLPCFIRYPKGELPDDIEPILYPGSKIALLACGSMAEKAGEACKILNKEGIRLSFFPVDTVKPLDPKLAEAEIDSFDKIVTVEENTLSGGFGSSILENLTDGKKVLRIGLPDIFIEQGNRDTLFDKYAMSPQKIVKMIKSFI